MHYLARLREKNGILIMTHTISISFLVEMDDR